MLYGVHARSLAQLHLTLWGLWTVAPRGPLSMELSRQEYRSGGPFPPPGELPNSKSEHTTPASPALAGGFFTTSATQEAPDGAILNLTFQ